MAAYNGTIAKREHLRKNAGTANNAFAEVTQQLKAMHSDIEASVTNHIASLRIECGKLKSRIAATDNRLADLSHTQAAINRQARIHKTSKVNTTTCKANAATTRSPSTTSRKPCALWHRHRAPTSPLGSLHG